MRARFGIGLFAGLLLGFLVVVGSTAIYTPGPPAAQNVQVPLYSAAAQESSTISAVSSVSTATFAATTTGSAPRGAANSSLANIQSPHATLGISGGVSQANGSEERAVLASQVDNMPRQPIVISLAAFAPVVAAVLFGTVFYRVSKTRQDEEAPPVP
ncbi:MAG TPA: hypothetical protein VEC02_01325 [Nitrososphaerales archaeon]|nr:hypothetical protein [Nitrososphaerales archaeon]